MPSRSVMRQPGSRRIARSGRAASTGWMRACGRRTVAEQFEGLLPGGVGIVMTRVFDASREDLWREWTEPAAFADWFGAPTSEVPLDTVSLDVRVGGTWRLTMFSGPRRRQIEWRGEYLEVDEPNRLVLTITGQP